MCLATVVGNSTLVASEMALADGEITITCAAGPSVTIPLEQLKKFKAGHRGAVAADVTGQQMRPTAIALPDEQAMMDVIAYIKSQSE